MIWNQCSILGPDGFNDNFADLAGKANANSVFTTYLVIQQKQLLQVKQMILLKLIKQNTFRTKYVYNLLL